MSIAPALVPQELRPRRTQLWLLAGRTTWGFCSRAARAEPPQAGRPENPWLRWPSALWRVPATIVSWLAFLPHPETLAAQGKAHFKVAPLTERTEPAPWWQRRAVAGLVFGFLAHGVWAVRWQPPTSSNCPMRMNPRSRGTRGWGGDMLPPPSTREH